MTKCIVWILNGQELSKQLLASRYENLDRIAYMGCSGICALYECNELSSLVPSFPTLDQCFLQVSGWSRWTRCPYKDNFPSNTLYGLRTTVLTTDETLVKYSDQLRPLMTRSLSAHTADQDSLTRQLWHNCYELLLQDTSGNSDLVFIYLKNMPNHVILRVADTVIGMLLSVPGEVPFLGILGFDPTWKKRFEDLLPCQGESTSFIPRQSFQSIDDHILEKECFDHHNTHLWSSFFKEGFTRRDNCCRFLPEECLSLGCNRVVLAEHLVYELAFLLEKVPKYGS
ncbi:hypothetical protein GAYE_SCF12G3302 [Galdieria yellowstonensis]|uniref:Uncharacterized protein n=1 Tax=Galdieria yellowstonensis TaxID=3028027 RepID=A0AAV9IDJ6_9RHOD|nr:hypothetical protein GAYE_SCF12G3302 [Galdieria yellowstonensis]